MSRTKGLLAANGHMVESKDDHGWINDGWIVASCDGPDAPHNARRLVACWNAMDGIDDPELWVAQMRHMDGDHTISRDIIQEMEKEIDALETQNRRLSDDLEAIDKDTKALVDEIDALKAENERLRKYAGDREFFNDAYKSSIDATKETK